MFATVNKPKMFRGIEPNNKSGWSDHNHSFEAWISTVLFMPALEGSKDLITAQIFDKVNKQQAKAANDKAFHFKKG